MPISTVDKVMKKFAQKISLTLTLTSNLNAILS